jgi:outer membrane protein TolC
MKFFLVLTAMLTATQAFGTEYEMTLERARKIGAESSQQVHSAQFELNSSENSYQSKRSDYFPTLSLEGSYQQQSHLSTLAIPNGPSVQFGDYYNYSVGPVIRYNLYNGSQTTQSAESSKYAIEQKKAQLGQAKIVNTLSIEQAYINSALSLEELKGTADNLSLAQKQYSDIAKKASAGSATKLDLLASKKEVLSYEILFRQSALRLSQSLSDLKTQLGDGPDWSQSVPMPKSVSLENIKFAKPIVVVKLDTLDEMKIVPVEFDRVKIEDHPELVAYKMQQESLISLSKAAKSSLYPRFDLILKSSYGYPDQTALNSYWQNSAGVALSMPIFEGSKSSSEAGRFLSDAQALSARGNQRKLEMQSSIEKAIASLESLSEQVRLQDESVIESSKYAKITFETYRLGKAQYLDVQSANTKLLEARNSAARIRANLLSTISQLNYLYGRNVEETK